MPGRSHARCKECRALIHSRNRYGLCPPHMQAHKARLEAERRAVKERRRASQPDPIIDAIVETEMDALFEDMTIDKAVNGLTRLMIGNDTAPGVVVRKIDPASLSEARQSHGTRYSDEQRIEMGRLYEQGVAVKDIARRFGASGQTVRNVARELGAQRPPPPEETTPVSQPVQVPQQERANSPEPELPVEQQKALENMLRPPTMLPPRPEPAARIPLNMRVGGYLVKVDGAIGVQADSIEEALMQVRKAYPNLHISGIEEV